MRVYGKILAKGGLMKSVSKVMMSAVCVCLFASRGFGVGQSPLGVQERARLRAMQSQKDSPAIVKAFADYMIENGRDTYGKVQSPLFAVVMDRSTGCVFPSRDALPYPNVKVKPFAPGFEREHKMRPTDRTYMGANPLEDLALFEILYRLTKDTGATRYRTEAEKANRWWMANTQSPATGLYPWGSHLYWDFYADAFQYGLNGYGGHEFISPWPYWSLNKEALGVFARGLWDHQIADKTSGNFNRHTPYERHGPDKNMEFGWPGASMISTWADEYALSKDAEMKRAILAVLGRWESLRDPQTRAQSAASMVASYGNYREQCWAFMNLFAANVIDEASAVVAPVDPELAGKMREYGRKTDDEFLSNPDDRLDVKHKGLLQYYIIKTGKPVAIVEGKGEIGFPLKDDTGQPAASLDYGCPWFVNRTYAGAALLMWERTKHTVSKNHRERYLQTVLETAEVYMSINPEIQWPVWGDTLAQAMELLLKAYEQTGNPAYLHRADQFGRLAIELLLDDSSPLPKINSVDGWYECVEKQGASNRWLLTLLEIDAKLRKLPEAQRGTSKAIKAGKPVRLAVSVGDESALFQQRISQAFADGRACVWDCAAKAGTSSGQGSDRKMLRDILVPYGTNDSKAVYCASLNSSLWANAQGVDADGLDLIISDVICHLPTPEEAAVFNGSLNKGFTGKRLGVSQAQYGNFKEVLKQAGLLLTNYGREAVNVSVTATYHDLYHDNGERTLSQKIEPGKSVLLTFAAPERKLIRRFDMRSDRIGAVKLEQMAFVMASLETFNPPPPELFAGVRPERVPGGVAAVASPGTVAAAQVREKTENLSKEALVFLIAGQSNAGGVASFSPETNKKAGWADKQPTAPGSTAQEVGIPLTAAGYPRSHFWKATGAWVALIPGSGYYTSPYPTDPNRHGIELPMAMLLEKKDPLTDKFFIKHGPGGHNLHTQWAAGKGADYTTFMTQYNGAMTDLKKRYEKVRVIGLYWDQGESDEKQAKAYEVNLRALFAALRKDTGIPDLQIYVREQGIFQHDNPDFKPIVAAQIKLCKEDPNAHLLTLDLGSNEKNFKAWAWTYGNGHLSSKAFLELANQIRAISGGENSK